VEKQQSSKAAPAARIKVSLCELRVEFDENDSLERFSTNMID
jgi:hypothetical protein